MSTEQYLRFVDFHENGRGFGLHVAWPSLPFGKRIEDRYGVPVVSSTPAAFWAAMRLAGESGHVAGFGGLLERSR